MAAVPAEIPQAMLQQSHYFWSEHWDFWTSQLISVIGLGLTVMAYVEARNAARAAAEAGKVVRIQTTTIELSEILQKLERLTVDIEFNEARDLLNEVSRRLLRFVAPFSNDGDLKEQINTLRQSLSIAKKTLDSVRPTDPSKTTPANVVYYAIEGDFSSISNNVAGLLGLLENKGMTNGNA